MDFGYTPANDVFRQEVRQFITTHVTPALRDELVRGRQEGRGPLTKDLFLKLGQQGWIGMSWPDVVAQRPESVQAGTRFRERLNLILGK